jgi:hypothetical protein
MVELREGLLGGGALRWSEVSECEAVLREVADDFGGEDVLKPLTRGDLDKVRKGLEDTHDFLQWIVGDIDLPHLNPESIAELREYILHFAERA